jgi:integrase/recombinase XerD
MKHGIAPYVPLTGLTAAIEAQTGLHGHRDKAILMLSHYMGLRAMELAALTIGDVYNLHTAKIKEVIRLLATMTKGGHYREVPLVHAGAVETLRIYLAERSLRHATAPLFMSQRGDRFSANTMQRLLSICYKRANVDASSHSGRRSYATHLIQAGADVYTVQCLLGHSSILTTQKYFTTSPMRLKTFAGLLV